MGIDKSSFDERTRRYIRKMGEGELTERTISEASVVFMERILEEHWLSSISTYLWPWGVKTMG